MASQSTGRLDIIRQLQGEVLALQGGVHHAARPFQGFQAAFEYAFPGQRFPTGVTHEFISQNPEAATATNGFLAGLLHHLLGNEGICLWVSSRQYIFPPALRAFGNAPDRVVFINCPRPQEVLWTIEEALKCEALSAVVGEITHLGFKESRRLQLAVEQSHVTGLLHRRLVSAPNIVACATRWVITPLPSAWQDNMPGVGFPRWRIKLLKVKNGRPGAWDMEWRDSRFQLVPNDRLVNDTFTQRKAG